jgi:hypothetical protein
MNLIRLDSVVSVLNINEQYVYPQLEDGSPDLTNYGVSFDEVSDEWLERLSEEDALKFQEAQEKDEDFDFVGGKR